MLKFSFVLLFLSIPFLSSDVYYGVPLWAYASIGFTVLYALALVYLIEKKWNTLKGEHE